LQTSRKAHCSRVGTSRPVVLRPTSRSVAIAVGRVRGFKLSIGRRTSAAPAVLLPPGWPAALGPLELAMIDTPTPYLLLDVSGIRAAYQRLHAAFDAQVEVCFAVKCNPDPIVLETLADSGANFDIASAAELDLVVAAGVDARRVLYSHTVKPAAHVASTYAPGLPLFAPHSPPAALKIAREAPR